MRIRNARIVVSFLLLTISLLTIISSPANTWINRVPQNPTPATTPTGLYFDHLVFIIMENEGLQNICNQNPPPCNGGTNTPYMASLANNFTIDQQFTSIVGTSEPNYIGILAGSDANCTSACGAGTVHATNLVDRFEASGLTWKAYMEDQTPAAGCDNSTHGFYEHEHNPFVEMNDIDNNPSRCAKIVRANPSGCGGITDCSIINDLNNSTGSPNFMWLTPNNCDNMHASSGCTNGCTSGGSNTCLQDGDNYLKSLIPNILNSYTFKNTRAALFVGFDEGMGFCPNGASADCIYTVWAGPEAKTNYHSSNPYNQYSFTRTIDTNWGLATLNSGDGAATPMTEFFKAQVPDFSISVNPASLTASLGSKANSTIVLTSINNFTGTATLTATSSPAGPTLTLAPSNVPVPKGGTGTSKLTFQTSTTGNYTITVKGVSGGLNHNTTLTVSVASPDFTISTNPSSLTFGQLTTTAGPSVAISSTSDRTYFESSYLTPSFYAQGLIWLFYENSQFNCEHQGGCLMYTTSTNGTTWATPTNVGVHITDSDFSVHTNGTSVFYVRYNETTYDNNCGRRIQFGLGKLSLAGTVTWSQEQTVTPGASNRAYPGDNIIVDSNGQVWISYFIDAKSSCGGNGSQIPHIIHSAGTNYASWIGNSTLCVASCNSNNWHIDTASLGNGEIYALYWLSDSGVFGRLYSGTSWGTEETVSTDTTDVNNWLFNKGTSLYAIYFDNNFESYYFATRSSSGTWTSSLIGVGESHTNAFSGYYSLPDAAAYDSRDGVFDLFYMNMTTQKIDQWQGFNTTWTRRIGFVNTSSVPYADSISSFIESSQTMVGSIFYISGSSSFTLNSVDLLFTNPGDTGNVTATVTGRFGFTGTVTLKTYVSPSTGLTASCNPSSIAGGSGTSACTLTSSTRGNYTVTIDSTSGSLTHNATLSVNVLSSGAADFSISASTTTPVNSGQSTTSTVTVTAFNGFAGTVTLSDTVPTGLACGAMTPGLITGSGAATISCSSANALNYTLTITGTSGSLHHSTIPIFRFQNFTLSATSAVSQVGASATSTLTITPANGFGNTILLSDTTPAGLSCTPITPGSLVAPGTATVSCSATTAGNYTLTVIAKSGSLTYIVTPQFRFQDFTITATSPTIIAGSSTNSSITLQAINGFAGTTSLSMITPSGLACGPINPNSVVGTGTATLSCSSTIAGNYTLTIRGTSGILAHNATGTFHIQDFTVSATSPAPVNVKQSSTSTITVTSLNHFAGTVNLTDTIPSGLTCGPLTPTSVTGSGSVALSCNATIAGNYTITIKGTSATLLHDANATFTFQDFTVATVSSDSINVGQPATSTITVTALNHFAGTVNLTDTLPAGLTCGPITPSRLTGEGTAAISCIASVAGNYTLTIFATGGTLVRNATDTFRFTDFRIATTSPSAVDVSQPSTATMTVTALNQFNSTVSLTTTVPSGLSCGPITPNTITGSGASTVSCTSSTAANYNVTINGSSGSLTHNILLTFAFRDFTVTVSLPTALDVGVNASSTVTITGLNQFSGNVTLTDTLPNGLSCGAITPSSLLGSGSATFSCTASIAGNYTVAIHATGAPLIRLANATFIFRDFTILATAPASVNVGQQATSNISITALNRFGNTINLTDIVPTGLSCGPISPNSITGSGTSLLTCGATVAGNYTLTLTATSTPLIHSVTIIFQFRDFTVTATPPLAADVTQSGSSTITISPRNHFNSTVTFSDAIPSGLTCGAITPTIVTGAGAATFSCSATLAGNYTVTITATSSSLNHNATAIFRFTDFTISATTPPPAYVGQSPNSTIQIIGLNRFNGLVNVTDSPPAGLTCGGVTPSNVTGSGIASISCMSTASGNFTITLTGTSSPLIHPITVTFSFQDFRATASSPAPVNIVQQAMSTITITSLNQFNGTVTLSDTSPSGLICGPISPGSSTGSGVATVSCTSILAGNYTLIITAASSSLVHNITATFQFRDFTITANSLGRANVDQPLPTTLSIGSLNHFAGTVSLTLTMPIGLTCGAITPDNITGSGIATLTCNSTIEGNYTLIIIGKSGSLSHNTTAVFTFQDFNVNVSTPTPTNINTSMQVTVTITSLNHFAASVNLTATIPTGLTCGSLTPTNVIGMGTAKTICTTSTAGNYNLTITGTSEALIHSASRILSFQDFILTATPVTPVLSGVPANTTITLTALNNFGASVELSESAQLGLICGPVLPANITQQGQATVSCTSSTAANYTLTVTAVSGSLVHTLNTTIQVQDFIISAPPSITVQSDGSVTANVTITYVNGFSGLVQLDDLFPRGQACGLISPSLVNRTNDASVTCFGVTGNFTMTIIGQLGSFSHSRPILIILPSGSVGGASLPVDKLELLVPLMPWVASIAVVAATVGILLRAWGKKWPRGICGAQDLNRPPATVRLSLWKSPNATVRSAIVCGSDTVLIFSSNHR